MAPDFFKNQLEGDALAILLPCYNEGKTIAQVVVNFRKIFPFARIFVYDNGSTDDTAAQARLAGAMVVDCRRKGKGNVVRQMFADIDAEIYLMADGDGTYDHTAAPHLVAALITERVDMVVGKRQYHNKNGERFGHAAGNRLFNAIYNRLFGDDFTDIFSGYRAFTRRFVKSFPAESHGFEIETEMSAHASLLRLPVAEKVIKYGQRIEGSESKLSTIKDGIRILLSMFMLLKETKPFVFFSAISCVLFAASFSFMVPVVSEYLETGLVDRVPTWILAMTLFLSGMVGVLSGTILDSVARGRAEQKRIHYLSLPAPKIGLHADDPVSIAAPRPDTTSYDDDAFNPASKRYAE